MTDADTVVPHKFWQHQISCFEIRSVCSHGNSFCFMPIKQNIEQLRTHPEALLKYQTEIETQISYLPKSLSGNLLVYNAYVFFFYGLTERTIGSVRSGRQKKKAPIKTCSIVEWHMLKLRRMQLTSTWKGWRLEGVSGFCLRKITVKKTLPVAGFRFV